MFLVESSSAILNPGKFEHSTKTMAEILTLFKLQSNLRKGFNMDQISRNDAVNALCQNELVSLSANKCELYILDWWGIDKNDIEYSALSADLQNQISENEEPPSDNENSKYNELIIIALSAKYKGVTNSFLAKSMVAMKIGTYEVHGEVEQMEVCPCCKYRTLDSRGEYDICGLCNWEDSGVDKKEQYSGPNHMTLGEGQEKFIENVNKLPLGKWIKA